MDSRQLDIFFDNLAKLLTLETGVEYRHEIVIIDKDRKENA